MFYYKETRGGSSGRRSTPTCQSFEAVISRTSHYLLIQNISHQHLYQSKQTGRVVSKLSQFSECFYSIKIRLISIFLREVGYKIEITIKTFICTQLCCKKQNENCSQSAETLSSEFNFISRMKILLPHTVISLVPPRCDVYVHQNYFLCS